MIFASVEFLFLFLPIAFCAYFLAHRFFGTFWAKWVLIAASFYFYWYGTGWFCLVFAASVGVNFLLGTALGRGFEGWSVARRRWLLTGAIAFNVALLGYYKYTDFVLGNINWLTGSSLALQHIVLPIGISFWTFQMIAYVVDAYRGKTIQYTFQNYLNFIAFFPHLLVGPIVHHKELTSQFEQPEVSKIQPANVALGLFLVALGAAKKLLLADPLTRPAQAGFDQALAMTTPEAWLNAVSYTISYYFDLSGYADMAIGLALLFNIQLPANFDSPYKATNFADYWRRWHMTLSRFLGDYVFRSLYKKGGGAASFYWATFITFLVSGFWHGAGWNFVLWGVINGLFVMLAHYWDRAGVRFPLWLAWAATFSGVVLLRVMFVADDLGDALAVYKTMFVWHSGSLKAFFSENLTQIGLLLAASAVAFLAPNSLWWREKFRLTWPWAAATAALAVGGVMSLTHVADFLYFQF